MNWSVCWAEIVPDIHLPAICRRYEDDTFVNLVPVLIFDIKLFQTITDQSALSLLTDLRALPTEEMTCEETEALNNVLKNDCASEFGDLQLVASDQLAQEGALHTLTLKIFQLRQLELSKLQWPNLVPVVMKTQSGWFTLNHCQVPFLNRGPTILVPRNLVLKACNASDMEKIQGWLPSAAEVFLMTSLFRQRQIIMTWDSQEKLLSLQQVMIVFKHKIFNGPRVQGDGFKNFVMVS